MLESINRKNAYHICLYADFMLEVGKQYDTNIIKKTYDNVCPSKKETEITFENFRIQNHGELPSRRHCLYVCTANTLDYWVRTITQTGKGTKQYKIFEIELSGDVFWADSTCFVGREEAEYWRGCNCDETPPTEGLFIGKYTVLREI